MPEPLNDFLPEIASRLGEAPAILLGLDFDGTLTPLRSHPDAVQLSEGMRAVLAELSAMPKLTVMIVSGRGMADVAERVGLPGLVYAGNHGMEIEGKGLSLVEPTAASIAALLNEKTERIQARLAETPGLLVEQKGLTSSVHYRNIPPALWAAVEQAVRAEVATESDRVALTSGNHVWEIRPRVDWHKGRALRWARHQLGGETVLPLYLGDDRTDEDAFASIPDGVTIKVGDPSVPTEARYFLPDPDAVLGFLGWIARGCTA